MLGMRLPLLFTVLLFVHCEQNWLNYDAAILTHIVTQPSWDVILPQVCVIQTSQGVIVHIFVKPQYGGSKTFVWR